MNNPTLKQANRELIKSFVQSRTLNEIINYNFRNERRDVNTTDGVVGFKEYKISSSHFDCDSCELTMSIWCVLLEKSKEIRKVLGYEGRRIHYIDRRHNTRIVETDTMNSLETPLNQFIRKVILRKYQTQWHVLYSKGSGISNGEIKNGLFSEKTLKVTNYNRDSWFIQYYEEIFDENTLTNSEKEILSLIYEWSNYIHTIGNFVLGPVGFNSSSITPKAKGKFLDDRADLFLRAIQREANYKDWRKQFSSIMDINALDYYFKDNSFTGWETAIVKDLRSGTEQEWMKEIIHVIRNRGLVIAQELKRVIDQTEV